MKHLLTIAMCAGLALASCVSTSTTSPDGTVTKTTRQDPKVIKELEPLVEQFGAGVTQGALDYLQSQQGSHGPNGVNLWLPGTPLLPFSLHRRTHHTGLNDQTKVSDTTAFPPLEAAGTTTFFAPDDDTLPAILNFVKSTQHSLYVADYGFVWPDLTQALIDLHTRGVDVQCVFDRVEAGGPAEVPELAKLRAAGVPFQIGSSRTGHIMHHKFMVRDGNFVLDGSFNFTKTASLECNFFDVTLSTARAERFLVEFKKIQGWMTSQEAARTAKAKK